MVALVFSVLLVASSAHAQTSVIGASTSSSSTTAGGRKAFFDPNSNLHWVFWYTGSLIEYASSSDGDTWISRGTLPYGTAQFSVSHTTVGGASYVVVAAEASSFDIELVRGSIGGSSITFDSPITVLDGTSATDRYHRPFVAHDSGARVWVAAVRFGAGQLPEPFQVVAARSSQPVSNAPVFASATDIGSPGFTLPQVSLVSNGNNEMLLFSAGASNNILAYRFDGTSWSINSLGAETGWREFALGGSDQPINSVALDSQGNLYVGGSFTRIGSVAAKYIARWDGTQWSALPAEVNASVNALAFDSSGNLYAAGHFTTAGTVSVNYIAKWDGSSWSSLGTGLNGYATCLAVDSSNTIYVGGIFDYAGGVFVKYIARWDGSTWSSLGGLSSSPEVMAVDGSNNLYVGGYFLYAGSGNLTVNRIAKWNGSAWSALGSGTLGGSSPAAIAFDTSGNVYVGGNFSSIGGVSTTGIAKWNGSTWSALGAGLGGGANDIVVDAAGNVYAAGSFSTAGGNAATNIAMWNGSSWSALGDGLGVSGYYVNTLALDGSGRVIAAGSFPAKAGSIAKNIARWDGAAWSALAPGLSGTSSTTPVYAVTSCPNGDVYVGGSFSSIHTILANNIVKWTPATASWSALGTGVDSVVYAMTCDSTNQLYVGGNFSTAGGITANRIARWNGSNWSALGTGVNAVVYTLALDAGGGLYVGGSFTSADGQAANRIARWDGAAWSTLGTGFNQSVRDIVIDSSGRLYASGTFTSANGNSGIRRLAQWDGTAWSSVGATWYAGTISALAIDAANKLYVGGTFSGSPTNSTNIALWDGTTWSSLGSGVNGAVSALRFTSDGTLLVGGNFSTAGGVDVTNIAQWSGSSWNRFGAALTGSVEAIGAADVSGSFFLGTSVGVTLSQRVAASDMHQGTAVSVVSDDHHNVHLAYIDSNRDIGTKFLSPSLLWSEKVTPLAGTIQSVAISFRAVDRKLIMSAVDSGGVKYLSGRTPYSLPSWSSPVLLSDAGTPEAVASYLQSSPSGLVMSFWNRAAGGSREVVASLTGGAIDTPTPTPTPTFTFTPTSTPTPAATPTLQPPPPPNVERGEQGARIVVQGQRITISGTGTAGISVEILVDGIVVGKLPIAPNSGGADSPIGNWQFTLPALAPGTREVTTTYLDAAKKRSAPSKPVVLLVVAPAPLDFLGYGDTAITTWRQAGGSIRFKSRRASSSAWALKTVRGRYPAPADYDGDGVTDIAAVGINKESLSWTITRSTSGKTLSVSLGTPGDTIVSGCRFTAKKGASLAVFRSKNRVLRFKNIGDSHVISVRFSSLGRCDLLGCGDTDGDGDDEVLFTARGPDKRMRLMAFNTTGKQIFKRRFNRFTRSLVVQRPESKVPLVAVIGGAGTDGRQVSVTTMAGSFAFPLFYVDKDATIATGTFTDDAHEQTPGIFWASRSSRSVYRRLLTKNAETTELFPLPKGYSLLRPQGLIRTEK